jgi:Fe-S-cluster containining protein
VQRKDGLPVLTAGDNGVSCCGRGRCCENNPGWFAPGEVEKAAEHMGLAVADFVNQYLVINSIQLADVPGTPTVEVFVPTKVDGKGRPLEGAGRRSSRVYQFMKGPCVFYRDRRCGIHPVRPAECRAYFCEQDEKLNLSHEAIGKLWYEAWKATNPRPT